MNVKRFVRHYSPFVGFGFLCSIATGVIPSIGLAADEEQGWLMMVGGAGLLAWAFPFLYLEPLVNRSELRAWKLLIVPFYPVATILGLLIGSALSAVMSGI